ncbi:MAG: lytic murein transglycosylase [Desulfobacterales bacterium]|nr:lytic murein transglycosylase [Desulfobacterales bacterium]
MTVSAVFRRVAALGLALAAALAAPAPAAVQAQPDPFAGVRSRLVADGFAPETVSQLYGRSEVFLEADGVSRFFVHSEARLNYDQFSTPESVAKARAYLQEQRIPLAEAEQAYGVEARVITAILLVESRLGMVSGSRSALNILSTLAALTDTGMQETFWKIIPSERRISRAHYDERVRRRAEWGYRELKALLTYAAREQIDPVTITSSYAGAVGFAQFMPTSIIAYARDGDGDGRVDLRTHADAIASIANYLKRHGWRHGGPREQQEKAVHAYNPSSYYVAAVMKVADILKE